MSDLKLLIHVEVCDYFGMQTNMANTDRHNFGKVCRHVTYFCGGGTVTLAAGSREAETWRQSCYLCRAAFCNAQGYPHLPTLECFCCTWALEPLDLRLSSQCGNLSGSTCILKLFAFILSLSLSWSLSCHVIPQLASSIISADRWVCVHLH